MGFRLSSITRPIRPGNLAGTIGKGMVNALTVGAADTFKINAGQKNDALMGGAKKQALTDAAGQEQQTQDRAAANEQNLLERADASFGVGLNPEAQANASRMRARRDAAAQSAFQTGRQSADQDYASSLSDTRATLARAGLTGSGVEGQARNDLLARYFGNITQAQQAGQQAGLNADNQATTSRLALRSGIRGGQITDTTGLGTEIAGLNAQGSNGALWENSIGKFAPVAAQQFANRRLAQAYGST